MPGDTLHEGIVREQPDIVHRRIGAPPAADDDQKQQEY